MKAFIRIIDESGVEYEGDVALSRVSYASEKKRKGRVTRKAATHSLNGRVVFNKPERAFIRSYARGLNGQKKFVLLLYRRA